nr:hypothetical protein [Tanacetum cinerariifolium]
RIHQGRYGVSMPALTKDHKGNKLNMPYPEKTNTSYPSRKIRCIHACTHQRPQRKQAQYAVSREDQYVVLEIWNEYNILEDIKRGPYSKKLQYAVNLDNSTSNVLITLDSWTSGLLVYKESLNSKWDEVPPKSTNDMPLRDK